MALVHPGSADEWSVREKVLRSVALEVLEVESRGVTRVAVDGVDGAGKTTFANQLSVLLAPSGRQVIRITADDFLNPRVVRHGRGRDSPDGFFLDSYDYEKLHRYVLVPLASGGSLQFRRRGFDVAADTPVDAPLETAAPDSILVLDGLFLHREELREIWDYSIFLEVRFDVSIPRCAARGTPWASADVQHPSNRRYLLGQRVYLRRCVPQRYATRVIDNNVLAAPVIIR